MIVVILLSLLVVTVVLGTAVTAMFTDVAFAGPNWENPSTSSIRGMNRGATPGNFDGAGLARRVEQAVSRAVAKLGMKSNGTSTCDTTCHQREIQVTVPEVLAIVDELREQQSPVQVDAIRRQARRNLQVRDKSHSCPLLMSGGLCACNLARPVSCRTHCFAGGDTPEQAQLLAQSVEMGVTETFQDCLDASGLDNAHYELNYALAHVLETHDAARRWARGEQILGVPVAIENS